MSNSMIVRVSVSIKLSVSLRYRISVCASSPSVRSRCSEHTMLRTLCCRRTVPAVRLKRTVFTVFVQRHSARAALCTSGTLHERHSAACRVPVLSGCKFRCSFSINVCILVFPFKSVPIPQSRLADLYFNRRVRESKKIPLLRFQFRRYSDFSEVASKISFLRFLTFLIEETLLFQMPQTATRSDLPFLFHGGAKLVEIFTLFETGSCLFFYLKTLKPFFSKLCFSKVQLQNAASLRVLHFGGSERCQSILNFTQYQDLVITQHLKSRTLLDSRTQIEFRREFSSFCRIRDFRCIRYVSTTFTKFQRRVFNAARLYV